MNSQFFLEIFINGLILAMTYMLIALGLTLVYGIMDVVNFAHGELYMLGAFGAWIFFNNLGINYFAALVLTMALVGGIGVVIERLCFRAVRRLFTEGFIVSLGLVYILQTTVFVTTGTEIKSVKTAFPGMLSVFGVSVSWERTMIIIAGAILIFLLYLFIKRSRMGQAMRAVAQDPDAASMQGIDINRIGALCMGVGAALAAGAGVLIAPVFAVDPFMGGAAIMKAFVVIVLGGLGNVLGTIVGAICVGLIESFAGTLINPTVGTIITFILLIAILILKPSGLLGHAQR